VNVSLKISVANESEMLALGQQMSKALSQSDLVLFRGELGAGKTTLIRGILRGLGCEESVKSPTYNLFSLYDLVVPVLHADLYRLQNATSTGIEDYLETRLCLVEWPDALSPLVDLSVAISVLIEFEGDGRIVTLSNINL
jgi:tRNA threonylcarbamoyladenosine biosynthesis protein TsaE